MSGGDVDFGATPVLFVASGCAQSTAAVAKTGEVIAFWNRNNMTGLQRIQIAPGGPEGKLVGIPAWDSSTQMLFVTNPANSPSGTCRHGLVAFKVQGCRLVLA